MKPFPYQQTAIDNAIKRLLGHENDFLALLILLATGAGKTLVYNEIIRQFRNNYPLVNGRRAEILVVSHDQKLIKQGVKNLKQIAPNTIAGIYSGKEKNVNCCVTYATIQSAGRKSKKTHAAQTENDLLSKLLKTKPLIDLLIIDECHRVSTTEGAQYDTLIKVLRANNPQLKVIGLTATPYRNETGYLWDDPLSIWEEKNIVYNNAYGDELVALFEQGYLVRPITKLPQEIRMNCDVKISGSGANADYSESAIEQANADKFEAIAKDAIPKLVGRKKILVFVSSIKIAENFTSILNALGENTVVVHGDQYYTKNDAAFEAFERGQARFLVSVSKTTTGYDFPEIQAILMLRPTVITALHVQMIGRATRRACDISHCETAQERLAAIANSDKPDALILDYTTNIYECGTLANPIIKAKGKSKKNKEVPIKTCGQCYAVIDIQEKSCPHCGYVFEALPEPVISELTVTDDENSKPRNTGKQLQDTHIDVDIVGNKNSVVLKKVQLEFIKKEVKVSEKGQYLQLIFCCIENGKKTFYRDALYFEGYASYSQKYNAKKWVMYTTNQNTPTTAQEAYGRFTREMKRHITHLEIDCQKKAIVNVIQETQTTTQELF